MRIVAIFAGKNRWAAAMVAIVMVLALATGPLCAPICSATICATGAPRGGEAEGCHGSKAHDSDGAKDSLGAVKTCSGGISVAMLSNPEEKKPSLRGTGNTSAALVFRADSNELDALSIANRGRWRDRSGPDLYSEVSLQSIVLRI